MEPWKRLDVWFDLERCVEGVCVFLLIWQYYLVLCFLKYRYIRVCNFNPQIGEMIEANLTSRKPPSKCFDREKEVVFACQALIVETLSWRWDRRSALQMDSRQRKWTEYRMDIGFENTSLTWKYLFLTWQLMLGRWKVLLGFGIFSGDTSVWGRVHDGIWGWRWRYRPTKTHFWKGTEENRRLFCLLLAFARMTQTHECINWGFIFWSISKKGFMEFSWHFNILFLL